MCAVSVKNWRRQWLGRHPGTNADQLPLGRESDLQNATFSRRNVGDLGTYARTSGMPTGEVFPQVWISHR